MPYDYFCPGCGKKLNQDTVLFDMQYLLTGDGDKRFDILKFRLTQAELKALVDSGRAWENGWYQCRLTLSEIMGFIGNSNNLNDPFISALTLAEMGEYIEKVRAPDKRCTCRAFDVHFFDYEGEEEAPSGGPYVPPASIRALESKDRRNTDPVFTRRCLVGDFEIFQGIFDRNDTVFEFQLKEENDVDNDGENVLVGYHLKLPADGYFCVEARICGKCGASVFQHAGTAPQKVVGFIGPCASGKTCTIAALTHYAATYMLTGFGSEIWEGKQTINSLVSVEILYESPWLRKELGRYTYGFVPEKADWYRRRENDCVTFRLKNRAQNRYHLITLMDVPGSLCRGNGTLDWQMVLDEYPEVLSSEVFVTCADTQCYNWSYSSVVERIVDFCRWTDAFQKLRADHNQVKVYVPTMLLLTKCRELEEPDSPEIRFRSPLLPLKSVYSLWDEWELVSRNNLYRFIYDQFSEYNRLKQAYHAVMRCSSFGYSAPVGGMRKWEAEHHAPSPQNIDRLMRWILSVTGCIPTEIPAFVMFRNFCISRTQLRRQNPGCKTDKAYGNIDALQEAMARCALFQNPGKFDRLMVGCKDDKMRRRVLDMESKLNPDTNDRSI